MTLTDTLRRLFDELAPGEWDATDELGQRLILADAEQVDDLRQYVRDIIGSTYDRGRDFGRLTRYASALSV